MTAPTLPTWREVWHKGFAPQLATDALERLRDALRSDDCRLVQGSTTVPPPLMMVQDWPVEAACAVGFCGWTGAELVCQVEEFFARTVFEADAALGGVAPARAFLTWWDDTPRATAFAELLPEVERFLSQRLEIAA